MFSRTRFGQWLVRWILVLFCLSLLPAGSPAQAVLDESPSSAAAALAPAWRQVSYDPDVDRQTMAVVHDMARELIVMFGGRITDPLDETWEFNGQAWQMVDTAHRPPARFWPGMAYDANRQVTVLFGGKTDVSDFFDTWEYDGIDWVEVTTAHAPSAAASYGMTYDTCRETVILFSGNETPARTWEYDGTDWTEVTTSARPTSRNLPALAFDSARCKAVLFGGGENATAMNDTWEYDGANWVQAAPAHQPPARWAHAMAYNPASGELVLFGGYGPSYPGGTQLNDTWVYNGTDWVETSPIPAPWPREQHAMAFEPHSQRVLMFGSGETWLYGDYPTLALGQPGLSYRRTTTLGMPGVPYPVDTEHFNLPSSVFIDADDDLYVTEENGMRILRYDASGDSSLVIGSPGDTWIERPKDTVVDADGNIWASMNWGIRQFDADGNLIQSLPDPDHFWEQGQGNDRFSEPRGLALDSAGRLYVADAANNRIQVYEVITTTLSYSTTLGVTGVASTTTGLFDWPSRLAFDSSDRLYVADTRNHRVQRCTYAAGWTCEDFFGESGVSLDDDTHLWQPGGVTVFNNTVYIADSGNYRVLECDLSGNCALFAGTTGTPGSSDDLFAWPGDAAVDSSGNIYISDVWNYRVQVFDASGDYLETRGETGMPYLTTADYFNYPWGVTVAQDGSLYVLEEAGMRLLKFGSSGAFDWSYGQPGAFGTEPGYLSDFWSGTEGKVALSANGWVYLPDKANHRVLVLSAADGSLLDQLGETRVEGDDETHFSCPVGVAISPFNGDIAIADLCNQRVQVFTSAHAYKATLGVTAEVGEDYLHFFNPYDVAYNPDGSLLVADQDNTRLQKCSYTTGNNYTCETFAGETRYFDDEFAFLYPRSVAVDRQGRVFVADEWNQRIQVYDETGAYLTTIGGVWGWSAHELGGPHGVAVGPDGRVYIANRYQMSVDVYTPGYPGWTQANLNGFGDRWNTHIAAMEVFDDALYVGTGNWNSAAQVWRTFDGKTWEQSGKTGFGLANLEPNASIIDFAVFDGRLYASTGWRGQPGQIWRSADGETWELVEGDGFDDPDNQALTLFGVFVDQLYISAPNGGGVEIWRSATGDAEDWEPVVQAGNGDANNTFITDLIEFDDMFYATVENSADPKTGCQVWQSDAGETWTVVVGDGFGNPQNDQTGGAEVFQGMLYVGTRNTETGAELWRSADGVLWEPVVGDTALVPPSFGSPGPTKIEQLFVFREFLYASLADDVHGMQLWRSADGETWEQVIDDGFGNPHSSWTGWTGVEFGRKLYLGLNDWANASGVKVWAFDPLQNLLFLPLLEK